MKHYLGVVIGLLNRSRKTVLLIVIAAILTLVLSATVSIWYSRFDNFHFPSIGTIRMIGVKAYWDASLENETEELEWGIIYPGSLDNATFYLKSMSNVETTLKLSTSNWTFLNSSDMIIQEPNNITEYMNLTWNYSNETLSPGEAIQVMLTLRVDDSPAFIEFLIENNVANFAFDIIIRPSEQ